MRRIIRRKERVVQLNLKKLHSNTEVWDDHRTDYWGWRSFYLMQKRTFGPACKPSSMWWCHSHPLLPVLAHSSTKTLSYLISAKLVDSKTEAYLGTDDLLLNKGNLPLNTLGWTRHRIINKRSGFSMASSTQWHSSPNTNLVALSRSTNHLKYIDDALNQRSTRHWVASGPNQLHVFKNSAIQSTSQTRFSAHIMRYKFRGQ